MAFRVIIVQSDPQSAAPLADYFTKRGDKIWKVTQPAEGMALLERHMPDLLFLDLHCPGDDWLTLLREVRARGDRTQVIITNKHPDFRREMVAKEHGAQVFLREPFTAHWIERAVQRLKQPATAETTSSSKPKFEISQTTVRFPVRVKITFPYVLLAIAFTAAAAYLITRYVFESAEDRFTNQLVDAGKQSADWMVHTEDTVLSTLRLVANVEGMPEAITGANSDKIRELTLPIAVNAGEEAIEVVDGDGASLLALRHRAGGGRADYDEASGNTEYAHWDFVQKVLTANTDAQGDKFAGMVRAPWGNYFYIAGPVRADDGTIVGVVLVGRPLDSLVRQMHQELLAHITLYDRNGQVLASTLGAARVSVNPQQSATILAQQDTQSRTRALTVDSASYTEITGPWEVRSGSDLGLLGVALAQNILVRANLFTNLQAFVVILLTMFAVLAMGVYIAGRITRPLIQMAQASTAVARGNFEVKVDPSGNDEVAVLARAFNYMVSGLQEGSIYRDILGRTVSPEVREELRQSFTTGDLRLEGHTTAATILMSDIRGFTTISEQIDPQTILAWLNEYFNELVPVITARGGVVDKFEGDAILAVFGVLPKPLPSQESSYQACRAAVDMLRAVARLNERRKKRGEPPLITGIGINTGPVTAGGLGTADRLNYTIIGDPVNTTQRLESFTRAFGESGAIISEYTLLALTDRYHEFRLEPLGEHTFKGKTEALGIYRLWPSRLGHTKQDVALTIAQAAAQPPGVEAHPEGNLFDFSHLAEVMAGDGFLAASPAPNGDQAPLDEMPSFEELFGTPAASNTSVDFDRVTRALQGEAPILNDEGQVLESIDMAELDRAFANVPSTDNEPVDFSEIEKALRGEGPILPSATDSADELPDFEELAKAFSNPPPDTADEPLMDFSEIERALRGEAPSRPDTSPPGKAKQQP